MSIGVGKTDFLVDGDSSETRRSSCRRRSTWRHVGYPFAAASPTIVVVGRLVSCWDSKQKQWWFNVVYDGGKDIHRRSNGQFFSPVMVPKRKVRKWVSERGRERQRERERLSFRFIGGGKSIDPSIWWKVFASHGAMVHYYMVTCDVLLNHVQKLNVKCFRVIFMNMPVNCPRRVEFQNMVEISEWNMILG